VTALALRALAFAERYGVTIAVVAGDRLSWQSQGPAPGRALEALKAAKGELINLLVNFRLDSAGGLVGDDLLAALRVRGFAIRRYGVNAALDDALRALRAPDCFEGNAHRLRDQTATPIGDGKDEMEKPSAAVQARELLGRLRDLGFPTYLDRRALYLADKTGWRRDPFRFTSPTLVFEVLNAGLEDDPALLNPREDSL